MLSSVHVQRRQLLPISTRNELWVALPEQSRSIRVWWRCIKRGSWAGAVERAREHRASEFEKCDSWFSIRNDRYPPTHHSKCITFQKKRRIYGCSLRHSKMSKKKVSLHLSLDPLDLSFWPFFYFFAPWYRRRWEAYSVKNALKIKRKNWSNALPKLLACIRFFYKAVHNFGRLWKFNRAREIKFNSFTAWIIFMKLGTLVHHVHGYKMLPWIFFA